MCPTGPYKERAIPLIKHAKRAAIRRAFCWEENKFSQNQQLGDIRFSFARSLGGLFSSQVVLFWVSAGSMVASTSCELMNAPVFSCTV